MTAGEMDLIIGADVTGAIAAFKKLGYTITQTEQQAEKFTAKSKTNFTGLSRVIQDLPFGFIAISNNLEQLLPAAGGLGLAFSAVVSALSFMQIGFQNWTRSSHQAKEASDEFKKSLRGAEQGAIETGVKLQAFVDIARDNTKTLADRNFALAEANKLMGEHGEKLTLVNINTAAVTEEINKFTKALIDQAIAAKFADKIADLIIRQKDALIAVGPALDNYNKILKETNEINKVTVSGGTGGVGGLGNTSQTTKVLGALKTLTKAREDYNNVTTELQQTQGIFNQTIAESVDLFGDLGTKTKETTKALKEFKMPVQLHDFRPVNDLLIKEIQQIAANAHNIVGSNFPIKTQLLVFEDPLKDFTDKLNKLNAIIQQATTNLLISVGEAIGNVLSGKGSPFDVVFQALGAGIKALGQQLIEISAIAQIVQKALASLITNPALALVAGIALVALGTAIANIKQPKKFATGGVVTKPTLALVGEQGPERITPLGYEGKANNMWGNGEVVFQISGQNLRGILRRADQTAFNTF